MIYLSGSLKNPRIPEIAEELRAAGFDIFDAWWSAGPEADDHWQAHERFMGHTFQQALLGPHATCVYEFDREHLSRAHGVVLVMPSGKSGHLEFGWAIGKGKPGWVLMEQEPERYDIMYRFANGVAYTVPQLGALMGPLRGLQPKEA